MKGFSKLDRKDTIIIVITLLVVVVIVIASYFIGYRIGYDVTMNQLESEQSEAAK